MQIITISPSEMPRERAIISESSSIIRVQTPPTASRRLRVS